VYPYSFEAVPLTAADLQCSCLYCFGACLQPRKTLLNLSSRGWVFGFLNSYSNSICSYVLYPQIPSYCVLKLGSNCLRELVCAFLVNKLRRCRGKRFFCCGPLWYSSGTALKEPLTWREFLEVACDETVFREGDLRPPCKPEGWQGGLTSENRC